MTLAQKLRARDRRYRKAGRYSRQLSKRLMHRHFRRALRRVLRGPDE